MSTARLSALWARELRSSQSQCLQVPISLNYPNPSFCSHLPKASLTRRQRQLNQRAYLSSTTSTPVRVGSASRNANATSKSPLATSTPARSYSQGSAISRLAKSALSPGASAETYIAYGMTQKLFQACSSQADYEVPQASQKGVPVPTTESGEHLGVSESWWYKGELDLSFALRKTVTAS